MPTHQLRPIGNISHRRVEGGLPRRIAIGVPLLAALAGAAYGASRINQAPVVVTKPIDPPQPPPTSVTYETAPTQSAAELMENPDLKEWRRKLPDSATVRIYDWEDVIVEGEVVEPKGVATKSVPHTQMAAYGPVWTYFHPTLNPHPTWSMEVEVEDFLRDGSNAKRIERYAVITTISRELPPGEKPLPDDFFPVFAVTRITYIDPRGKTQEPADSDYQVYMKPAQENLRAPKIIEWKRPQSQLQTTSVPVFP